MTYTKIALSNPLWATCNSNVISTAKEQRHMHHQFTFSGNAELSHATEFLLLSLPVSFVCFFFFSFPFCFFFLFPYTSYITYKPNKVKKVSTEQRVTLLCTNVIGGLNTKLTALYHITHGTLLLSLIGNPPLDVVGFTLNFSLMALLHVLKLGWWLKFIVRSMEWIMQAYFLQFLRLDLFMLSYLSS